MTRIRRKHSPEFKLKDGNGGSEERKDSSTIGR
jgi:hypothetical protein